MKNKTKPTEQIADGIRIADAIRTADDMRCGIMRWGSFDDLERLYRITRSAGYYLIAEGKIKSRLIKFQGSKGTGRRLIDLRSVEAFLDACPVTPTKGISRRMRNAALRSAAVRAAFNGRAKKR